MRPTEIPSSVQEVEVSPDRNTRQAWQSFVEQLATKFHIDFTRVGAQMYVDIPGSILRLIVQKGNGCIAIAYGIRMEYGLLPDIEIVFDGGWTPLEVRYSDEFWQQFAFSQSMVSENASYIDYEALADHVLDQLKKVVFLDNLGSMS